MSEIAITKQELNEFLKQNKREVLAETLGFQSKYSKEFVSLLKERCIEETINEDGSGIYNDGKSFTLSNIEENDDLTISYLPQKKYSIHVEENSHIWIILQEYTRGENLTKRVFNYVFNGEVYKLNKVTIENPDIFPLLESIDGTQNKEHIVEI